VAATLHSFDDQSVWVEASLHQQHSLHFNKLTMCTRHAMSAVSCDYCGCNSFDDQSVWWKPVYQHFTLTALKGSCILWQQSKKIAHALSM
jgi:hypothetical protein